MGGQWPKYLRRKTGWVGIIQVNITGETSRSWLDGPDWQGDRRDKRQKKDYEVCTEHDYSEQLWRDKHQYRIGQLISNRIEPAILRQIAEMIGYGDPR